MKSIIDIERGDILHCRDDGFTGVAVGFYTTLHGMEGVVLQPQETGSTEIIRGYEVSRLDLLSPGPKCDCPTCREDRSKDKMTGEDRLEFHMLEILGAFVEYKSFNNEEAAAQLVNAVDKAGAELTNGILSGKKLPYYLLDKMRGGNPEQPSTVEDEVLNTIAKALGLDLSKATVTRIDLG